MRPRRGPRWRGPILFLALLGATVAGCEPLPAAGDAVGAAADVASEAALPEVSDASDAGDAGADADADAAMEMEAETGRDADLADEPTVDALQDVPDDQGAEPLGDVPAETVGDVPAETVGDVPAETEAGEAGEVAADGDETDDAGSAGPTYGTCESEPLVAVDFEEQPTFEDACPGDRWVFRRPMPCDAEDVPAPSGGVWAIEPLIAPDLAVRAQQALQEGLPVVTEPEVYPAVQLRVQELLDFCVAEWEPPPDGGPPRPEDVQVLGSVGEPDRDCRVVVPFADGDAPIMAEGAREAFMTTVGHLGDLLPVDPARPPVRVAVIDDRPNALLQAPLSDPAVLPGADGQPSEALHGLAVRHLITELTCHADPAAPGGIPLRTARPYSHRALELRAAADGTIVPANIAGTFGHQSELARAIFAAWVEWLAPTGPAGTVVLPAERHMVLNLSVGFDPRYAEAIGVAGPVGGWSQAVQAIYTATELNACSGALIIAAAGNDPGGTDPPGGEPVMGPTMPGEWEMMAAPPECWPAMGEGYRPLVHAVGGVDGADRDLVVSRALSRPRLVAPSFWGASHPASECLSPGQPHLTEVQTGTSVGTAVVSALVADVWHHLDPLRGAEVMQMIYDAAVPLPLPQLVCFEGQCGEPRRVSICRTLHLLGLMPGSPDECPESMPGGPAPEPWEGAEPIFFEPPDGEIIDARELTLSRDVPPCRSPLFGDDCLSAPESPCAERQFSGGLAAPWAVDPQPDSDPDPVGLLWLVGEEMRLTMRIRAPKVLDPVLVLLGEGDERASWDLSRRRSTLEAGHVVRFELTRPPEFEPTRAYVSFRTVGRDARRHSARSQLAIRR